MWTRHVFDPWVSIQPIGLDGGQVCWIHGLTWVCTFCIALYNFIWGIGAINATCGHLAEISRLTSVIFMVLSVYTSYCSSLGAILEVLWSDRGVGCADNRTGCSPTLATSLWPFNVPGIALPVHGTNGFKWLPNHWVLHVFFSLARSEGGRGRGMRKKAPFLWLISSTNTYISRFCRKIKIKLYENSSPIQTQTHAPESEITYGRD